MIEFLVSLVFFLAFNSPCVFKLNPLKIFIDNHSLNPNYYMSTSLEPWEKLTLIFN